MPKLFSALMLTDGSHLSLPHPSLARSESRFAGSLVRVAVKDYQGVLNNGAQGTEHWGLNIDLARLYWKADKLVSSFCLTLAASALLA